ncbi:hypothetical protein [Tahibacter harae]|uniref:Polymer-forming cytoskeletal protein n=1 Tax=Tahibacter harae TaxID=2963937 RepID=A0ABT1QYZ2_9GAMM|nr:hypothetical protein [Tahibacter harae]MCQ4167515.1 hypothetical protein [Tahibacter harae]
MSMRTLAFAVCIALSATAAQAGSTGPDIDKVNGSIRLEEGQLGGDLETVNGSIYLGNHAKADSADTVNGSIELGDDTEARSLETVNGAISLGQRARVSGDIESVNGAITLERGADVKGKLSNVNGRIRTESARVGGDIETVAGDIDIGADSRIDGGILVEKPSGWSWGKQKNPRVVIGPNAVVTGRLVFHRDVDLFISDSAKVGAIEGATARRFSGSSPN